MTVLLRHHDALLDAEDGVLASGDVVSTAVTGFGSLRR
ncbi:MAG: hypothetical protein ACI9BK_002121 [Acidimicrobiales bacterium]|jgi:hypothetical protein